MIKPLFISLLIAISCMSLGCQKEAIQHELDIETIKKYLSTNNITAIEEPTSNYFYDLYLESGDSISPIRNEGLFVDVRYEAWLLDGTSVASTDGNVKRVALDEAIYGWQLAMPQMHIGDKMRLFLPSRLAYGTEGQGDVPANAVLFFDIELVNIYPHF